MEESSETAAPTTPSTQSRSVSDESPKPDPEESNQRPDPEASLATDANNNNNNVSTTSVDHNNNDDVLTGGGMIPKVALRWYLLHATTSNVELAHLSNVCRSWRQVVTTVVLEQASHEALPSGPLLLLPSMAAEVMRTATTKTQQQQSQQDPPGSVSRMDSSNTSADDKSSSATATPLQKQPPETFCAAWFAPEGIQVLDLDAEQNAAHDDDEEDEELWQHQTTFAPAGQSPPPYSHKSHNSTSSRNRNPATQLHRHCRHHSSSGGGGGGGGGGTTPQKRPKSPMTSIMMNLHRRPPKLEQIPQKHHWARGHGDKARVVSFQDQGIVVSHEWQGYRHAMQILHPFQYAEPFVQNVLQQAQFLQQQDRLSSTSSSMSQQQDNKADTTTSAQETAGPANQTVHSNLLTGTEITTMDDDTTYPTNVTQTTIAVRGATVARPEGYCLCWESPAQSPSRVEWTRNSGASSNANNNDATKTNPNNNNADVDDVRMNIKFQERQRKLRQWKEWRRQLQLTVLPQILFRASHSVPAIQFLNSDEKHAVRFQTPQFTCGPIGEPVTILLVGIATEDGCFCSGLNHRFELGHLYPDTPVAELSELSPVCMATDPWEPPPPSSGHDSAAQPQQNSQIPGTDDNEDDDEDESDEDFDSDDSSSDLGDSDHRRRMMNKKKSGWLNKCSCIFQDNSDPLSLHNSSANRQIGAPQLQSQKQPRSEAPAAKSNVDKKEESQTMRLDDDDDDNESDESGSEDDNDDDDDGDAERIMRGSRVPGLWHCYSAVFDGHRYSELRVDGISEVLTLERPDPPGDRKSNVGKGSSNDLTTTGSISRPMGDSTLRNHHGQKQRQPRGPRAMLDGLTIGSDHCFDMTLCYGDGSGGEGEGSIAEIAVFSGRLDKVDLETLEQQLMRKHGIPFSELTHEALVKEDDWTRKAHALYCQLPPEVAAAHLRRGGAAPMSFEQGSIPLRIMAKHRSVAWHQNNPVTGEELRIKRIGSRSAGSSSDW